MTHDVEKDCQLLVSRGLGDHKVSAAVVWSMPRHGPSNKRAFAKALGKVAYGRDKRTPPACVFQVALSASALINLGVPQGHVAACGRSFNHGMTTERLQRALGDLEENHAQNWAWSDQEGSVLWLLYAKDRADLEGNLGELEALCLAAGMSQQGEVLWTSLPEDGREPFGFADGITRVIPQLPGVSIDPSKHKTSELVAPGEVVLGQRDALKMVTDFGWLGNGGSFLVARQLEQDVESFWGHWLDQAGGDRRQQMWLAAKAMGRWPNGAPMEQVEPSDEPPRAKGVVAGRGEEFDFVADRHGAGCPLGAHIRRARPRMGLDPEDPQLSRVSDAMHRLVRRGRKYGPPAPEAWFPPPLRGTSAATTGGATAGESRGLFFVALMGDFARQFEFVQQTWLNNPGFVSGALGSDPIAGGRGLRRDERIFAVPNGRTRRRYFDLPVWITVKAGGYFLLPGRGAIERIVEKMQRREGA